MPIDISYEKVAGAFLALAFVVAGCGKESRVVAAIAPATATACSGNFNGEWAGPAGARVSLEPSCAIRFESAPSCKSVGTYTAMMGTTGYTTITINAREGSTIACPAPGRFQCAFIASGGLTLNCGAGAVAYFKVFK